MKWLPIETAPKDGTDVLACRMFQGQCIIIGVARWDTCNPIGYADRTDKEFTWRAQGTYLLFPTPTHWMPLPPPPEE
jgi:hypothetical protein